MAKQTKGKDHPLLQMNSEPAESKKEHSPSVQVSEGRLPQTVIPSSKAERQELFIPISGFVWLYPEEIKVLDHPSVQRLSGIYQLGQTYFVYRGATHKRIEHAIGTVSMVQRMIDAVRHTSEKSRIRDGVCGEPLGDAEERFVRLGALLHDIGHVAAGHTVEDELGLIPQHDSDERLQTIFEDSEGRWLDQDERTLAVVIDKEYEIYVPKSLLKSGVTASILVRLLIRKPPKNLDQDKLGHFSSLLRGSGDIRLDVCRDMIGNTICADLLDYLHRDWDHVGKGKPVDVRILQYMEIRPSVYTPLLQRSGPQATDQFVISLGDRPKIRTDAVSQILELLEWRYQLAEAVLFHRTKLAAAAMLDRALFDLWGDDAEGAEKVLLDLSDEQMLEQCRQLAEEKKGKGSVAANILKALQRRQLFKGLTTHTYHRLLPDARLRITKKYAMNPAEDVNLAPTNRCRVLQLLEADFSLAPGSLAMYCPSLDMKAKIAEVKIAVGKEVDKFSDYEKSQEYMFSGGHLDAQIRRFAYLWRIHFFIERREKQRLVEEAPDMIAILRDAVACLALGLDLGEGGVEPQSIARRLAIQVVNVKGSPWQNFRVRAQPTPIAAYGDDDTAIGAYPFGAPSIRSFLDKDA